MYFYKTSCNLGGFITNGLPYARVLSSKQINGATSGFKVKA